MHSNTKPKLIYFHVHRSPYKGMTSLYFKLYLPQMMSAKTMPGQDTMRLWSSDFAKMAMTHMNV
jgi:hypothetical protein